MNIRSVRRAAALPCLLLLVGAVRHVAWNHAGRYEWLVWNVCGALAIAVLLTLVWRQNRSAVLALVVIWWLYEEALVVICSAARVLTWWPVLQGQEQCSVRIGIQLGELSLVVIGALAMLVAVAMEKRDV